MSFPRPIRPTCINVNYISSEGHSYKDTGLSPLLSPTTQLDSAVNDTHITLLRLSVDGFNPTFGQSPKEFISLYNREQSINVINLGPIQIRAKSS